MSLAESRRAVAPARGRTWLWALGTILVVAAVMASAYVGHRYVAARQIAARQVPGPATPPAPVLTMLRPEGGAAFVAPADAPDHLVLVAGPHEQTCSPVGGCDAAPTVDQLLVVDLATGATRVEAPVSGPAQLAAAVAVDQARGLIALIAPQSVSEYALSTGTLVRTFPLPAGFAFGSFGGVAVGPSGTLLLTTRHGGQSSLLALDEQTGASRFHADAPTGATLFGPIYDPNNGLAYALAQSQARATFLAITSSGGVVRGAMDVPPGTRLGPLDSAARRLYLFGADGTTWLLSIDALAWTPPPDTTARPAPAPLTAVPALRDAQALGWNTALGHLYAADAHATRIVDAASGKTLASVPLPALASPDAPLLVDEHAGTLIVSTQHGAVAVLRDATDQAARVLTADTAVVLARDAVVRVVPQGAQEPPFFAARTFTPGPGSRDAALWLRDPDLGWQNASPSTASVAVTPASGERGSFDVTFTVVWMQHGFSHTHTAVCRVAPSGAVRLVSDVGDALP
ncbi:MAG TPA: hypothetical protein VF818_11920 [Ktedonobacterales bacterium]